MKNNIWAALGLGATVAGCAAASTIQTSQNTAIVQSSAAPACGGMGAARVAQKQAAIATIKAGYDRYMIVDAASANNVRVYQTPGTYNTTGFVSGGYLNTTTTYQPGMPVVAGSHDQSFAIRMFKDGEPGASNALSAREALGPEWQKQVSKQIVTCTD
jgi:hypothetical protein